MTIQQPQPKYQEPPKKSGGWLRLLFAALVGGGVVAGGTQVMPSAPAAIAASSAKPIVLNLSVSCPLNKAPAIDVTVDGIRIKPEKK